MRTPHLTKRLLRAMEAAVAAMGAGMEGEGDWPQDVTRDDLDRAYDWIDEQFRRRRKPKPG